MDKAPDLQSSRSFDNLKESEIREFLSLCEEDKHFQYSELLRASNDSLAARISENKLKIEELKQMNVLLIRKTMQFVDKECAEEAMELFVKIIKEFE